MEVKIDDHFILEDSDRLFWLLEWLSTVSVSEQMRKINDSHTDCLSRQRNRCWFSYTDGCYSSTERTVEERDSSTLNVITSRLHCFLSVHLSRRFGRKLLNVKLKCRWFNRTAMTSKSKRGFGVFDRSADEGRRISSSDVSDVCLEGKKTRHWNAQEERAFISPDSSTDNTHVEYLTHFDGSPSIIITREMTKQCCYFDEECSPRHEGLNHFSATNRISGTSSRTDSKESLMTSSFSNKANNLFGWLLRDADLSIELGWQKTFLSSRDFVGSSAEMFPSEILKTLQWYVLLIGHWTGVVPHPFTSSSRGTAHLRSCSSVFSLFEVAAIQMQSNGPLERSASMKIQKK